MSRIPPWVPALDACLSQATRPHTFTFCTVSRENQPRARTCVLRSWLFDDKNTGVLLFTTDKRSSKVTDLAHNNGNFEACFYFPNTAMQFRLSGFTQVLSLSQYPSMLQQPAASASLQSYIPSPPSPSLYGEPVRIATTPPRSDGGRGEEDEEENDDWSERMTAKKSKNTSIYPVYSPSWKTSHDIYNECGLPPKPTPAEWKTEYLRVWSEMRQAAKSSFRRPTPGTSLSESSAHLIDAISRGVDGSSDEDGLENFNVMVMFVNSADVLGDRVSRRSLYERVSGDDWIEQEVCP